MTVDLGASSGVVICASHNPAEDNGIKFFARDGMKLPDGLEDEIEARARPAPRIRRSSRARSCRSGDARERYLRHLEGAAEAPARRDDASWSTARTGPPPRWRRRCCGASAPRSTRSTPRPTGATSTTAAGRCIPRSSRPRSCGIGADAGVCHDGDADRALFADAAGAVIDGDQVLAASAIAMRDRGALAGDVVVATVMSNLGLRDRDARCRDRAGAHRRRGPLRPGGDGAPRRHARRGAERARDLPAARHHRRRAAHGRAVPLAGRGARASPSRSWPARCAAARR